MSPNPNSAIETEAVRLVPEALDRELLALAPALSIRRWATFFVMAFTAACALLLALMLQRDVAYLFTSSTAVEIGDVLAADVTALPTNRLVRLEGAPMVSNAVYYRHGLGGGEYVAFSLAGQRDVWVQVPVEGDRAAPLAGHEFEGRLVRVGDLGGRFDAVTSYLSGKLDQPIDDSAYLLLAGEAPRDAISALALVLLALSFVVIDGWLLLRWFKPLPIE